MGEPTGFKQWGRVMPARRDRGERVGDYREIYAEQAPEESRRQAGRCMDCGVPFCQQGCPLGNQIPDWNDLVYREHWEAAYRRLAATNNFPEFTGRLCPAPCEAACVLAINQPSITIEQIEKDIIEHAFSQGWVTAPTPQPATGKRVAIVGSGPAGLAAAAQLRIAGHEAIVYERDASPGGLLRYGIPDFKIEKWVIDRRIDLLRSQGIEFRTGVNVGDDVTWSELHDKHDALLVTVGAQHPRDLDVPGADLSGVVFAMDYLRQNNRVVSGESARVPELDASGKHVVILGGGDTGSDCLGTALRQGARSVVTMQLWPEPPVERSPDNPWPQWPMVFRTSSSQEEGGDREYAVQTTHLTGDGVAIQKLHAVRIAVETTLGGRKRATPVVGSEHEIPCDLLIVAIGFAGAESGLLSQELGVAVDDRGNLRVDADYATSRPGVYAAGDAMRGASLIVWAIMDGREAARGIDKHLRASAHAQLPSRGTDSDFGGPTHSVERLHGKREVSDDKPAGSEVR